MAQTHLDHHVHEMTARRRRLHNLVVVFTLAVALLAAAPFQLLSVVSLLAALTLTEANRWLRAVALAVSVGLLLFGAATAFGLT